MDPKSYTLNPIPQILNLKTLTLNLQPCPACPSHFVLRGKHEGDGIGETDGTDFFVDVFDRGNIMTTEVADPFLRTLVHLVIHDSRWVSLEHLLLLRYLTLSLIAPQNPPSERLHVTSFDMLLLEIRVILFALRHLQGDF